MPKKELKLHAVVAPTETMICIIRHGRTELNKANVLQGRSNYPLNDEGIEQAERAADAERN